MQTVKIFNHVVLPAVTYGLEVIRPTPERLKKWELEVRKLVNKKVGVHWLSTMELHTLPVAKLGVGIRSPIEALQIARIRGLVHRGLNSTDKHTAGLIRNELFPNGEIVGEEQVVLTEPVCLIAKKNEAWQLATNDLRLIFKSGDPALKILRSHKIRTTGDFISEEGEICQHLREGYENLESIFRRVCQPNTYSIDPIILHRLEHKSLDRVKIAKSSDGTIDIFTDASIQTKEGKQRAGYGVHVPSHSRLDSFHALNGSLAAADAEAYGIAAALSLQTENVVSIYTDSKVTRDRLSYMQRHNNKFANNIPLQAREPLAIITKVMKQRKMPTYIKPVLSHTADGLLPEAKAETRRKAMTALYGEKAKDVVQGNQKADELAKKGTNCHIPNLSPLSKAMPEYILVDQSNNLVSDSARYIREALIEKRPKRLINEQREPITVGEPKRKMYEWLQLKDTDWKRSSYLGKNTDPALDRLQNFTIKLRRGLIADKHTRWARKDNAHWKKRYGGVTIKDELCDLCREEVETRFHFCICRANSAIRAKITTNVLNIINRGLIEGINEIPIFWAADQRHEHSRQAQWGIIENRQPEYAAMGVIPSGFTAFLAELDWLKDTSVEQTIAEIQIAIVKGYHSAWVERCKAFNKANRSSTATMQRTERIRIREERREEKKLRKQKQREESTQQTAANTEKGKRQRVRRKQGIPDPP